MEKAKLNTYSVTIDYESPRPINFGDVYYEAYEENKEIPCPDASEGYCIITRAKFVKMTVEAIRKTSTEKGLEVCFRLENTDKARPYRTHSTLVTWCSSFLTLDEPFDEYAEREISELKKWHPEVDIEDITELALLSKHFTTEEKASEFTNALNEAHRKGWEAFRKNEFPSLPSWEDAWKEEEEKND